MREPQRTAEMSSSRAREVEHRSLSACAFEHGEIAADIRAGRWEVVDDDHADEEDGATRLASVASAPGVAVRVAPMAGRGRSGWTAEHFHPDLVCPASATAFVVTLEAVARECLAVALSPAPDFVMGRTYVAHVGAGGNLSTVVRRRRDDEGAAPVETEAGTPGACDDRAFRRYWIACRGGRVRVGVGDVPGRRCAIVLDDALYDQTRPGQDRPRYVGIGNSSPRRRARDLRVRDVRVTAFPEDQADLLDAADAPVEWDDDAVSFGEEGPTSSSSLGPYHDECAKARARAARFGGGSAVPAPEDWLRWSEARRLRANPEPGFITGIDVTSEEERTRRRKRKERFEREERERRGEDATMDDNNEQTNDTSDADDDLPVEQAWDNMDLVGKFRVDPPTPSDDMDQDDDEPAEANKKIPEKIHLFAIDWAAFKQLHTDDIMAHFSVFGPSYVEWLGELSCNVVFQDEFSAVRAMDALYRELPSPPPFPGVPDLAARGWRVCRSLVVKRADDRRGRRGTRARSLARVARASDALDERPRDAPRPPPGHDVRRVRGPGDDDDAGDEDRRPRKRRRQRTRRADDDDDGREDAEAALDRGLQSSRAGFTVEEMERERAARVAAAAEG